MVFKSFGLSPELCTADVPLYNALKHQASIFCGIDYTDPIPAIGKLWGEGEIIKYGTHSLQVRCTPGHTPGSVFLYDAAEGLAFSGDTLFRYSIGRTDFEGGSFEDIDVSLHQVVAKLPPETVVLTGHGGRTKIKDELLNNPYLQ
jgi:glyoxylase-like metal-dependent hydrolase (beta-lactamase superfamily II)